MLTHLNEASVLYNLKRRYSHWMIYVSRGDPGAGGHPWAGGEKGRWCPSTPHLPPSPHRPTQGSSASPSTPTSGCPSTPLPWWRPTRASGAPRCPRTSTPSLTTPTTTCCAVSPRLGGPHRGGVRAPGAGGEAGGAGLMPVPSLPDRENQSMLIT